MKKILLIVSALMVVGVATTLNSYAAESSIRVDCSKEVSAYTITVYMIKNSGNVVISTKKSASYDSDKKTITVDGDTYRVQENPEYGKSGKRGSYRYVAGGVYYFNL